MSAIYANSMTYFAQGDHLGSTRLLTGYPTPSIVECDDYYPFGELTSCGGSSITTHEFTGNERDSKSDLDNFGARYDSSAMGRFMSPDPGNAGADPSNPQSWNMYSYVMNDPLTLTDPTGMFNLGSDGSDCDLFFGCGGFGLLFDLGIGNENDRQPPIYSPPDTQNTTEPNPPAGDPDPSSDPFGGETNGIPNGLKLPSDLASIFLPTDSSCAVTACIGSYFQAGEVAVPVGIGLDELVTWLGRLLWPIMLAKGGASQNPLPSWVTDRPQTGESADEFAKRVCQARYPPDGAGCFKGAGSEFNRIRKWAQEWIDKHR
ncbi:MAG: RHS repeat-associated core domain-containing protein [Candidatus Acidiferrales bacterium]